MLFNIDEKQLMLELKNKDERALKICMNKYYRYVVYIVENIIGSALPYEDKEAVVSNVFVALWNYSADLDTDNYSTFKPYLGTIARNMAKNALRKTSKMHFENYEDAFQVGTNEHIEYGPLKEEVIKREKSYYAKQAELLEQRSRDIKGIQHDMKNHLFAIGAMVKNKNKDAEKYIDNILGKIISDELYSSTGNIAIDSVINFKLSKASEIGTLVKADIKLPSGLQDGLEDLVTIIGNLLDNAIEALSDIDDNEKRLEIEVRYNIGNVNIDIKNSYNGELNYKNGKIETKKHDKNMHGIGLESVKTAVEKHYGTMDIHHNNKEFHVNIMLYL